MKRRILVFLFFSLAFQLLVSAQYNFNAGFEKADPVNDFPDIELEERFEIHEEFLENALKDTNQLSQVYAYIYLYYDCLRANDFAKAAEYLLKAENIVEASGKPGWKGWIKQRRAILEVILKNYDDVRRLYNESILLCRQSGDSLCVAKGYEQLGSNYAQVDSFDLSAKYFAKAFPLLDKYAPTLTKGISYNNYGILLSRQGQPKEARVYMEKAIQIFKDQQEYLKAGKAMNNLADSYRRSGDYLQAEKDFHSTIAFNIEHKLDENLIRNYLGLSVTYDSLRNYKASKYFLEKHYNIQDSLVGIQTRLEIEELENNFKLQEKELEIQKGKADLLRANRSVERTIALLSLLLLIGGFLFWRWMLHRKKEREERLEQQKNLNELTQILSKKNAKILEFENLHRNYLNSNDSQTKEHIEEDVVFFNERILTHEDWTGFKHKFDKSFPNFRYKLKKAYPTLTDGEERLFLLIKLNLNTQETANILGISKESVKKNRYRLRKKLELQSEENLEELVHSFEFEKV